jgi:predicted RNase H-like HicB family nuclease
MGEIERAEVAQLEEDLRHLFESCSIPPSSHGLSGETPGIWALHVASNLEGTSGGASGKNFEAVLEALDNAVQAFAQVQLGEILSGAASGAGEIVGQTTVLGTAPGHASIEIEDLKKKLDGLEQRLRKLELRRPNLLVPINTFAPEPYELAAPLFVTVEIEDDQFMATFFDANISAAGDTEEEAIDNLKSLILDTLESLSVEDPKLLGPEPVRQLAALRGFLRPASS